MDLSLFRGLVEYLDQRGLDTRALLQGLGLDALDLSARRGRVALQSYYALLEQSAALLDDPWLGLDLGLSTELEEFDLPTVLLLTAANLGQSLRLALRFQRLWSEGERMSLSVEGERARLRFRPWGPPRPAHLHTAAINLVESARFAERLLGRPWAPREVELYGPERADARPLMQALGAPLRWDQPCAALVFPAALLGQRLGSADPLIHQELRRQADERLSDLPESVDLLGQVSAAIAQRLESGQATLSAVAAAVGRSPRSLQRDLADRQLRFGQLLRAVREERSRALLREGVPITEVAARVGYSQTSAFSRAFRSWTGRAPTDFKA